MYPDRIKSIIKVKQHLIHAEENNGVMKDTKKSAVEIKKIESTIWREVRNFDASELQLSDIYGDEVFHFQVNSALQNYNVKGKEVINVGGGSGREAEVLLKAGASKVVIVDIALGQLKNAVNRRVKQGLTHLEVILGDADNIPVVDKCFDLGFVLLALHHFPDHEKAISEICRVSKEILFIDIMDAPITRALNLLGLYKEETHEIPITPNRLNVTEVEKFLNNQKIGMKVKYIFCPPYYGNSFMAYKIIKSISKIVNSVMKKNETLAYIFGNVGIISEDIYSAEQC